MRGGPASCHSHHSGRRGLTAERRICGIDFDNTIITYDELLAKIARERGLLNSDLDQTKRKLRDRIRELPNGEIEWQRCQALMYGSRIGEAKLTKGVPQFFERCRRKGVRIYIVSHKTEFSRFDTTGSNLRSAALGWMTASGFFERDGLGIKYEDIFFADTRQTKIDRIAALRCTHFIDDLEETFLEPTFPQSIARILYEPGRESAPPTGVMLMKTWQEISDYFFHTH